MCLPKRRVFGSKGAPEVGQWVFVHAVEKRLDVPPAGVDLDFTLGAGAALLELSPRTGRMHQLRVHLASIGRPIAGDVRYGGALSLGGQTCARLMLHAAALDVPLAGGERLRVTAPPPADMSAFCAGLGLVIPAV